MFGCLVAGRLLQTNLQQIDETHVTFSISQANTANHIVVFLLGTIPFPPGYAATVHFEWPGRQFQLLGMLSNEKPSAVFRLRGNQVPAGSFSTQGPDVTATLGISIESIDSVQAQVAALPQAQAASTLALANMAATGVQPAPDAAALAERIVTHLFNHLSSFDGSLGPQTMVPLGVIQRWYENFLGKLRLVGVSFLTKTD